MSIRNVWQVVCTAAVVMVAGIQTTQAEAVRGDINGWQNSVVTTQWMNTGVAFSTDTNYYTSTITSTTTRASSGFKIDRSMNWSEAWGYNSQQPTANVQAGIVTKYASDNSNFGAETAGMRYTFRLPTGSSTTNKPIVVMATSADPVDILSVSDDSATAGAGAVSVTVELSDEPSGETVWVRWTTGSFSASSYTAATVDGTTATATIPGHASGTIRYYPLTSTMPVAQISSQPDLCTLRASVNGGSNYQYVAGFTPGECWHEPNDVVGETVIPMRNPVEPTAGVLVYVYAANYQKDGEEGANMTGGNVWYRKGDSGTWTNIALAYDSEARNSSNEGYKKYWIAGLPTSTFAADDELQYYFEINYSNASKTYMGSTNQVNGIKYELESDAQAKPFSVTFGEPVLGMLWHYPQNEEPWAGTTMRFPETPLNYQPLWLRVGSYPSGIGAAAGATAITVHYQINGGTWTSLALAGETNYGTDNSNTCWSNTLPAASVTAGSTIRYYFEAAYANSGGSIATTYLGTTTQEDNLLTPLASVAAANAFATTVEANLGNAWHLPAHLEPASSTMRSPLHPYGGNAVTIYVGNQAHGDGITGNMTGGAVFYKTNGAPGNWLQASLTHAADQGYNKYFKGEIPAYIADSLTEIAYVIRVDYSDRDTTYVGYDSTGNTSKTVSNIGEASPFTYRYGGTPGEEPGYIWHGGNAVKLSEDTIQLWVKVGYKNDSFQWADDAEVRWRVTGAAEGQSILGAYALASTPGKKAVNPDLGNTTKMTFSHEEEDGSSNGNSMWWVATITDAGLASSATAALEYQIAARKTTDAGGNGVWYLAEYQSEGNNDQTFLYRMRSAGANQLTVNGVNADYTTTKFFIDEGANETARIRAVYAPPVEPAELEAVELFSNVGRRDFWNADVNNDNIPDSILPPSGDLITTNTTDGYYAAYPMAWNAAANAYVWEADIDQCGAYRLTARYKTIGNPEWRYYSETGTGIRDHAVVISPKKVLQQNVYELNTLSMKADAATKAGRSTFESLIDGGDSFGEFGIDYLNKIQANCLWFQPIHISTESGMDDNIGPGSPYATKDYFAVGKWFGRDATTAGAMQEFTNFVWHCDIGRGRNMSDTYVGTINIMLDGVFNHTSWDAVLGEWGVDLLRGKGITQDKYGNAISNETPIGFVRPGWFANYSDYGAPATFYNGPNGGQHDIACGPDRGDFGKWYDTAELFYGRYASLVRHNPDDNSQYLSEEDWFDYSVMETGDTAELWEYMGGYPEFWLQKTGHSMSNRPGELDAYGTLYDDYGIDGLRCDFGQGLPPQFWEYIINRTRAVKWNFMFMAESLDGGNVSYRSNRHFDILNESFVFGMVKASSPSDVKDAIESRKSMYSGGAILLNLTSHDEIMPYDDPWQTASRYAMVSSVMGLPMIFYGQEQGIVPRHYSKDGKEPGDSIDGTWASGFARFELNMGKWVPHFKDWNKITIWDDPPSKDWASDDGTGSRAMAQWYGRVGWARLNSPALQSGNQYFLGRKGEGTYDNGRIFAVAKYEESGAVANDKDAVLAFTLFVNGDDHSAMTETYDLSACFGELGLLNNTGAYYNVRNLASTAADAMLWSEPKSGADLYANGITVVLESDTNGNIYDDGHIVQYLKIEAVDAPLPPVPTSLTLTLFPSNINMAYQTGWGSSIPTVKDQDGNVLADAVVSVSTADQANGVTMSNGWVTCTPVNPEWVGQRNPVTVTAEWGVLIQTAILNISVPLDHNDNGVDDVWEWDMYDGYVVLEDGQNFNDLDSDENGIPDYLEYIAGTDPTDAADRFEFVAEESGEANGAISMTVKVKPDRVYQVQFCDVPLNNATSDDWGGFNEVWTNTGPNYVVTRQFIDDGTSDTSGSPIDGIRIYRMGVSLPQ